MMTTLHAALKPPFRTVPVHAHAARRVDDPVVRDRPTTRTSRRRRGLGRGGGLGGRGVGSARGPGVWPERAAADRHERALPFCDPQAPLARDVLERARAAGRGRGVGVGVGDGVAGAAVADGRACRRTSASARRSRHSSREVEDLPLDARDPLRVRPGRALGEDVGSPFLRAAHARGSLQAAAERTGLARRTRP